jgi:RNA polymerase sigma factor (sigma-70 family)
MTIFPSLPKTDSITPEAFAKAYGTGFGLTIRFLRSKGASIDAAEELAQTAWVRGWEARSQLRAEGRIVPWINSIAYHRFCNEQRRLGRHAELIEVSDTRKPALAEKLDAGMLLGLCSPIDKILLTKRYLEGLEVRDIAANQGLSEVAVRVRIHRCQSSLRERVANRTLAAGAKAVRSRRAMVPRGCDFEEPVAA